MRTQTTLNIIGCGRVGQTLGRLWHEQGVFALQDVHTRSLATAMQAVAFMGAGRAAASVQDMRVADVWMLAVPDTQLAAAAAQLAGHARPGLGPTGGAGDKARPIAFHCSGFLASSVLQALRDQGWAVASAHPVLSFASPASAVQQFAGTPCGLEGDAAASATLGAALAAIGGECFALTAADKPLYHAAAVFATNFVPVLQGLASDLWRDTGVPPALIPRLGATLLRNAVDNVLSLGAAGALTGPAARGDTAVVQAQGEAVSRWNPLAGDAYRALSALAMELARSRAAQTGPPL
ncbi:MAG: Rossmann-like and DUF2520 domain-containing protein [Burkholderiaceae bacterium]